MPMNMLHNQHSGKAPWPRRRMSPAPTRFLAAIANAMPLPCHVALPGWACHGRAVDQPQGRCSIARAVNAIDIKSKRPMRVEVAAGAEVTIRVVFEVARLHRPRMGATVLRPTDRKSPPVRAAATSVASVTTSAFKRSIVTIGCISQQRRFHRQR
jgi:hypothetical protein